MLCLGGLVGLRCTAEAHGHPDRGEGLWAMATLYDGLVVGGLYRDDDCDEPCEFLGYGRLPKALAVTVDLDPLELGDFMAAQIDPSLRAEQPGDDVVGVFRWV